MPQRSRRGCWTCKKRHKKCDEARPVCQRCIKAGLTCDGYEVRLNWGSPTADTRRRQSARARATTYAAVPSTRDLDRVLDTDNEPGTSLDFAILPPDELDLLLHQYGTGGASPTADVLLDDETAQQLLNDFSAHGYKTLLGWMDGPSLIKTDLLPLCSSSLPLKYVCIAYQASLSANTAHWTPLYMQSALSHFLHDLSMPDTLQLDSTLATGVLLCSVSINSLYSWTPLLTGLYGVLQHRGLLADGGIINASPLAQHLFEVFSLMDIECFTLNRRSQPLGIWKTYVSRSAHSNSIEQCSGLPYSLVNIMADLHSVDAEHRLIHWPGIENGEFLDYHLWEAFRNAGILHSRALVASGPPENIDSMTSRRPGRLPCGPAPSAKVLQMRTLACVQAILDSGACVFREHLARDLLYPLFIAGVVAERPEERRVVRVAFQYLADLTQVNMESTVAGLVFRVWDKAAVDADYISRLALASELASEDKIEINLF